MPVAIDPDEDWQQLGRNLGRQGHGSPGKLLGRRREIHESGDDGRFLAINLLGTVDGGVPDQSNRRQDQRVGIDEGNDIFASFER